MKDYENNTKKSLNIDSGVYNDTESLVSEQDGGYSEGGGGKKKISPKVIAIIAACAVAISVIALAIFLLLGGISDDINTTIFKYEVNPDGKTCTVTGFKGNVDVPKDLVIPEKIGKYKVTEIGNYAFYRDCTIESVEMPDGITEIGYFAFFGCGYLRDVSLPESVTVIGSCAFNSCNDDLKLNIPDSLKTVGSDSDFFRYTSTIEKEGGVYYASKGDNPYYALVNASETGSGTIQIYASTVIVPEGFGMLYPKGSFTVEEGNEHFTAIDGSLYSKDGKTLFSLMSGSSEIKIPKGVETVAEFSIDQWGKATDVLIPSSVKSISGESLANCLSVIEFFVNEENANYKSIDGNLYTKDGKTLVAYAKGKEATHFIVPDGVEKIGDFAFFRCKYLTSVTLPDSITYIGEKAFSNCKNLNTVNISDGVTSIGDCAFEKCGELKEARIPNTVKKIGSSAFLECSSITEIVIPDSVESIGNSAFRSCINLENISIGKNLNDIDPLAFSGNQITDIEVSSKNNNYKSIDGSLYSKDGKVLVKYAVAKDETAEVSDGVKKIGDHAFDNNDTIESIVLPEGVKVIGNNAFSGCRSLEEIEIPSSVTTIGKSAFYDCTRLKDINYNGSQDGWNKIDIVDYEEDDWIWKRVEIHCD